ncbi:hypothetical protein PLESTB_001558600 [Pleodorina starrii]|uniref:SRCR domain-containing protein n=1 Tax=Pleodorina starrii TaxID=330485 RepID=A0A9W6BXD6_9CHLO|nr:hypothetical protein PLESTB_001558600 [Pleodorina starrii]
MPPSFPALMPPKPPPPLIPAATRPRSPRGKSSPPPPSPHPATPPGAVLETCGREGSIRLVGGNVEMSGMLQYCGNDGSGELKWGSVCGQPLKTNEATMVCKMLGFKDGFAIDEPRVGSFGLDGQYYTFAPNPADMPIWLHNIFCPSNANDLMSDCGSSVQRCKHGSDVAVACLTTGKPIRRYGCGGRGGTLRLMGGPTPNQGTVQVCKNNLWGTVCDTDWDDADALVACRQLGYASGAAVNAEGLFVVNGTALGGPAFPQGARDMKINYANLRCVESDEILDYCMRPPTNSLFTPECRVRDSRQDAGLVCWN